MRIFIFFLFLTFLTSCKDENGPSQILDISGASTASPGLEIPVTYNNSKDALFSAGSANLGNRYFIASVFRNIFLDLDTATNAEILEFNKLMDDTVMQYPDLFGGAPNYYSTRGNSDAKYSTMDSHALPFYTNPTPARASILIKTCKQLIQEDIYAKEALRKANIHVGGVTSSYDTTKLEKLYGLFYLGETVSPDMQKAFNSVAKKAQAGGFNNLEQWRYILYLICESPYWQQI